MKKGLGGRAMEKIRELEKPDIQYWPDIRWWLAEGFHTDQTLKSEIQSLHEAGFGAVEFLAMEEQGVDSRVYGWGSEEWIHDTHTIVQETTKRGMGVSMTSGTNWSNANLTTITPDDRAASKELDAAKERIPSKAEKHGKILKPVLTMPGVTKQELVAVVAARIEEEREDKIYLDRNGIFVLTGRVKNGELDWQAPGDGDYMLFYFWLHGTGQTAQPSVSTSYTINYMDRYGVDAFKEYWDSTVLTEELKKNLKKNGRGMMYMDSLELGTFGKGGQLWGYHYLEEFEKRRGYDLTPYLPFVLKDSGMMQFVFEYHYHCKEQAFIEKLHNDFYQTMTDLYMENMLKPMQEWLHGHGMTLRAEISYGLPFEISQPGKYVDGIETESLEFASQIESYRSMAGAAHIYDKTFSSETGATFLNYMMGLDFYTQIIFTQFAAGVTKTVLHGYASASGTEGTTQWPGHEGMWPIFSERFGSRQPAFRHYNDWTSMLARFQMLLRKGKPRMDLGILRLDYYINNQVFAGYEEEDFYANKMMRGNEGMYWKDMQLQNQGYTWDYFAPQLLEEEFVQFSGGRLLPEGPGYRALIVYQEALPQKTAEKLLSLAKAGLPVLLVNGVNETLRPFGVSKTHQRAASKTPFLKESDEQLENIVEEMKLLPNVRTVEKQEDTCRTLREMGILPAAEFAESNPNILTHVREDGGKIYVYVYNMKYTEKRPYTFVLKVQGEGRPYRIDCWNAEAEDVGAYTFCEGRTVFEVSLAPGEACIYVLDRSRREEVHAVHTNAGGLQKNEEGFQAVVFESGDYEAVFSDGRSRTFFVDAPRDIPLPVWNLTVEDWNEGDKECIVEDRGKGFVTKEVFYKTRKTLLEVGETELKPWKDIPAVGGEVSGIGYYTAEAELPKDWDRECGALLQIGSLNHHTAAVYVNDKKARAVDIDRLSVDISELLHPGKNKILVEVSSSLNNRLRARNYYESGNASSQELAANANNALEVTEEGGAALETSADSMFHITAKVRDYGMTGEVKLRTYRKVQL